jgi:ketosteroid isomerase-like protein
MSEANTDPMPTIERLLRATNTGDVDAIVACFSEGYTLDSPLHPARSFRGNEQVRRNWMQILGAVRDLRASILGFARDGRSAWTEWEMVGTRRDGGAHCMRGVFIFRVEDGCIVSGRMFLEPVDMSTSDADDGVRQVLTAPQSGGSVRGIP